MDAIQDFRLPLAILAPLVGAGLVMATGKKPNLREGCSFLAALIMFSVIAWMLTLSESARTTGTNSEMTTASARNFS